MPLYSPTTWEDGSSGSHTDDEFYSPVNLLMGAATGTGPGSRTLSQTELGILRDIGYTVVPEPTSGLMILLGSITLVLRRRR